MRIGAGHTRVGKADRGEHLAHPTLAVRRRVVQDQHLLDLTPDGEYRIEGIAGILQHQGHLRAPQPIPLSPRETLQILAVELQPLGERLERPAEKSHDGACRQ
jgi:hypothetical protein